MVILKLSENFMLTNKAINNSIINLLAQIIPVLIALIFIPISIKVLGSELFGIYSLVVTLIVLFNYLNFGIAPATTKEVSRYLAKRDFKTVTSLILNSFFIMLLIGMILAFIFITFNDDIASYMLKEKSLITILSRLLEQLGILSPFLMIVIFLRSVLEANHMFLITSVTRAFLNSTIFIAPIIIYINRFDVFSIFKFIIVVYIITSLFLGTVVYKFFFKEYKFSFNIKDGKLLFNVGFWMMISSLAGIGLYYADRFIIGAVISALAVSYYVAAYDLVTRLNIISGSLTAALFPAFAHWQETGEKDKIKKAIVFVSKVILLIVSIVSFLLIVNAKDFLYLWINEDFSQNSYLILQLLTIGVLFNTLSVVPFRALSAIGFPDVVAKVYIIEMPISIILAYFLIMHYGLIGAVMSYNIRAISEVVVLYLLLINKKYSLDFSIDAEKIFKIIIFYTFIFMMAFLISSLDSFLIKSIISLGFISMIIFINYKFLFNKDELVKITEYKQKIKAKF